MLEHLTPSQRELAEYMSDLSEEAYCAGWMMGLEYALWQVLLGTCADYGFLVITAEQKDRLRHLSVACGGWIMYDDENGETWIPTVDWENRFLAWKERAALQESDG